MRPVNLPERPPSPEERERTVRALCTHFAEDRLAVEEFESRLDRAWDASTAGELETLLADLPALADEAPAAPAAPPPGDVRERGIMAAVLGGYERRGTWTPPRHLYVVAVWGGAELDFREARLPPGVTKVTILAVMGGAGVIVPPGLAVQSDGVAIMGGFEGLDQPSSRPAPDAPILRINGFACMGGVEVVSRLPGETTREAERRLRAERKARRLREPREPGSP